MEWPVILALVLGIPIILFPAAYVWYLNLGGVYAAIKKARAKRLVREEGVKAAGGEKTTAT
jgi:hypothetical protein